MSARVLVIALDAAETTLLDRWRAEGRLPALDQLSRNGTRVSLSNTLNTIPDAIWPELYTGKYGHRIGQYFHQDQIHTGEAHLRKILPEELEMEKQYWSVVSRAGKRVAVFDQAMTAVSPDINGIQLVGWGLHNPQFGYDSIPDKLGSEIQAQYKKHPIHKAERYRQTPRRLVKLLDGLLEGNERRAQFLAKLLNQESWDLFTCMLSEAHCAGHIYWHFQDQSHPDYDPTASEKMKSALLSVYKALDTTVARLIESAGPDDHVLLLATHGMGPFTGGSQLLQEVLVRLGMGSDGGKANKSAFRNLQMKMRDKVPLNWVAPIQFIGRNRMFRKLQAPFGGMVYPLESPNTRAAWIPNNRIGAIRLNLKGREPFGCVEPGAEADALIAELKFELSALVDPVSGQAITERIFTPAEAWGPEFHSDVPDLMVKFRTDLGRLDACHSERVGLVHVPAVNARVRRSGDHTDRSTLWVQGPGIQNGKAWERTARMVDIAPTILNFLDVPLPGNMDGQPLFRNPVGKSEQVR